MYVARVAAARERHVTLMPTAQLRHEAGDEARKKDFQTPGTGRSSLFSPYWRREDRGSGIVCWLDFPVYQSDTLLQEKHPWILVSVRNIDIYYSSIIIRLTSILYQTSVSK